VAAQFVQSFHIRDFNDRKNRMSKNFASRSGQGRNRRRSVAYASQRWPRLQIEQLENRELLDTGIGMIAGLTDSASARFVTGAYYDLLNRIPSTSEVSSWLTVLNSGSSNVQVAQAIVASPEYRSDLIVNDYEVLLGREPAPSEVTNWLQQMQGGLSENLLTASFLSSVEYSENHGPSADISTANADWLTGLYHDVLGRAPDPAGLASWEAMMQAGANPKNVALDFLNSQEAHVDLVTADYQNLLRRNPDPTGLANWTAALGQGLAPSQLIADIVGSPEYANDQTANLAPTVSIIPTGLTPDVSPSYHFKFGPAGSPVPSGYIAAPLVLYTQTGGFGWASLTGLGAMTRKTGNPLTSTFILGTNGTFLVDLPNGIYNVSPTLGESQCVRDDVAIWAQGQLVGSQLTAAAGQFIQPSFRVQVTDGQLNLNIVDMGGQTPKFAIEALDITPATTGPYSIWNYAAMPSESTVADPNSVELGVKFQSQINGLVTGIRFYKGPSNTGIHVGQLFTNSGTLLASATFTNETASGWQEVDFSQPVAISANTTYIAAYHTNVGDYSATPNYFTSSGAENAPLQALSSSAAGGNGLYAYGPAGTFPTATSESSNYWVDVFFTAGSSTPPTVTGVTPMAASSAIPMGTSVSVTFSEAMNPATIGSGTIQLDGPSSVPVTATVTYNSSTNTATLVPSASLANSTTYTAIVLSGSGGVMDVNGNALAAPYSWTFTTSTPPTVTAVTPANGANGIAPGTSLAVTFSEAMNAATIGSSTIELKGPSGSVLPATVTYNSSNNTATLLPTSTLANSTTYMAVVVGGSSGVKDPAGNPLASNFSWTFTTSTPPTVTAVNPAAGSTGVAIASGVTVTFSEAMTAATVGSTTIQLKGPSGAAVPATVTYNSSTFTATLVPSARLANSTTYTAVVLGGASGVKDTVGDPLAANFSWSFTTSTLPTVTAVTPVTGATGIAIRSTLSVTFSEAMNAATISGSTIQLTGPSGTTVPATVAYNPSTFQATLTPFASLANSTTYTAVVLGGASGVKDTVGDPLAANFSWTFTTSTPPTVTAVTPVTGATGIAIGSTLTVTFSEAMNAATVTGSTIQLTGPSGAIVPATVAYNPSTFQATLTPSVNLANSTTYGAVVLGGANGVSDAAGDPLATNYTWAFTTSTPPAVAAVTPATGATGVAIGSTLTVTFSEAMNASTISGSTIQLTGPSGVTVPATVTYNSATFTATLTPSANLANSTTYTAVVLGGASGAKDTAGDPLAANYSWTFTTASPATGPTVTAVSPANGSTGVATGGNVTVTFSEAINAATISSSTIKLDGPSGVAISATITYNSSTNTVTLTPASALSNSTTYTGVVVGGSGGVKDATGNPLAANYTWSFTTSTPPTVTVATPANASTGIAVGSSVTVTFSEAMNAATIGSSTIQLKGPSGAAVAASVSYNSTTFTATLTPTSSLANSATYSAVVTGGATGVKDPAGDPLAANYSWSFTTSTPPTVTGATPANASTGIAVGSSVTVTFSEAMTAATISSSTIQLKGSSGAAVASSLTYNSSTFTATLTPTSALANSATYTTVVTGGATGVKDTAGDPLAANYTWTFTTSTPPTVTAVVPANASTGIAVGSTVAVTFSEAMSAATISSSTIQLKGPSGVAVAASVSYNSSTFTATLTPTSALTNSTTYTAIVTGGATGVQDTAGDPLATNYTWTFTTLTAPSVAAVTPASASTGIAIGSAVTVTFNEAMNGATISSSTVQLKGPSGVALAASVSYNSSNLTATLTPTSALANSTTYTAVVTGGASGVKDTAGDSLAANYTWTFTTSTPPTVVGVSPANASTGIAIGTSVTVTFSEAMNAVTMSTSDIQLKGPSGVAVAATVTYNSSTFTATLVPTANLALTSAYTATVSGVQDVAGDVIASSYSWSFTTASTTAVTYSLWNSSVTPTLPDQNENNPVNLGVQFTSATSGLVLGIRFYKGLTNTGTHIGDLWTSTGQLLASGTFANETASGWQTLIFSSPVSISAGTVYVASYLASVGQYAETDGYFSSSFTNGPLSAPSGWNGVYVFSSSPAFPTQTWDQANFWVDAIFAPPSLGSPTVASQAPASGATSIATTATVTATFSEGVQPSTVNFVLKDSNNNTVPGTVSYNSATNTVVFTPTNVLNSSTTYTATILGGASGVQDWSDNTMVANCTWSFTTASLMGPPVANAGPNFSSAAGSAITFLGSVAGGQPLLNYSWTFGDGGTASGLLSPSHAYLNSGSYVATLTVTDSLGRSSQSTTAVTISDVPPAVTITGQPASATVGTPITLNATITSPSPADTSAGFTEAWSVAKNGVAFASGTGASITFTPDSVATFVVNLSATDRYGQTGYGSTIITTSNGTYGLTIPQTHPTIWFNAQRLAAAQQWYAANPFTPSSADPLNDALAYLLTGNQTYAQEAITQLMAFTISSSELAGVASDTYRWNSWVPIVYDWCYGAMTASQQQTFMNTYNGYTSVITQKSWGGPTMPASNYFWGYLSNEFNWAIATYYINPSAQAFLQDALVTRWQNSFLPYAATGDGLGGVPAEGSQYGRYLLAYPMVAWTTAALMGDDVFQQTGFYLQALFQTIYSTTPVPVAGSYEVFAYGDDESGNAAGSAYLGDYMTVVAQVWASQPAGQYARQWLSTVQPSVDTFVTATDPGGSAVSFVGLPTDYYAPGAGYLYTRNQWGTQGTSMVFQLGQPNGDGHNHKDAGSFQIFGNGQWLTTNDIGYDTSLSDGASISSTEAQNCILVNGEGESSSPMGEPHVLRLQSTATYSYAAVDLTPDYRSTNSNYDNPSVNSVQREFLYIKPMNTLIILDRVASSDTPNAFLLHFPNAPTVQGNTAIGVNGNQELIDTSLTAGATNSVVNEGPNGQYRFQETVTGAAQSYFLNVLQATSVGGPTVAVSMTQTNNSWTINLDSSTLGHAVVVLQAGMTTSGGSIGYSATSVPTSGTALLDHVQSITVTPTGPQWGS